jgi:hypothetical protein
MRPMMASSGAMRDLGRRLLIGLAVVAAAVMAIGYAFIAGRIADPIQSDLGTFPLPDTPGAQAVLLADGRPAYIVATDGEVVVVDARGRHADGAPGRLVAWCDTTTPYFVDPLDDATYAADGTRLAGSTGPGLVRYPVSSTDEGGRIRVAADGAAAGQLDDVEMPVACEGRRLVHRPEAGEIFDPSVAADEEPPGWIWLEGRLRSEAGDPVLCDGVSGDCATSAPVGGIDPALIPGDERALSGSFIGRVRDGVIVDLNFVPDPGGPS